MKSFTCLATLTAFASQASAHYIWQQLTVGGTKYPAFTYIRQGTQYNSPVTDLTSVDMRCNFGGIASKGTTTYTIAAGSPFTFTLDTAVYHQGPVSIYMSKAPGAAADYDGSGQWFKIYEIGPTFSGGQATWDLAQTYSYSIPKALPSGDYLLRMEQLGIHNPYPAGTPQFYIGCAQLTVTNGGSGTPGPLVSIPGWIKGDEPGYTVNIYNNFNSYTVPGPAVWSGQNSGGSGGSPAPTTPAGSSPVQTTTSPVKTSTAPTPTGATVPKYGQCGGQGWSGGTVCAAGSTCTVSSQYYWQCL